jgi:DNA polymerase-3 subunit delta
MIFFLYGADTYSGRQKLNFYRDGFMKKYDPSGFNIAKVDGEKATIDDLNKAISTAALFSTKRMVIIENLIGKNKNKDVSRETMDIIESQKNNDNVVIFWEEITEKKDLSTNPLFKKLIKDARVEEFKLMNPRELNKWVKDEFNKQGAKIRDEAIINLVGLVENDLWQMSQEINKLASYKKEQLITTADVVELVKGKFDDDIFRLTDTLAHKNKKQFLKLLDDQFASGANEIYLLTMLVRLFRILLEIKSITDGNNHLSKYSIAEELGLHPFVVEKSLEQTRNFSLDELKNIYQKLLDIDFKIKTGQAKPRLLFELLAVEI